MSFRSKTWTLSRGALAGLLVGVCVGAVSAQYTPKDAGEYVAGWTAKLSSNDPKARVLACQSLREMARAMRSAVSLELNSFLQPGAISPQRTIEVARALALTGYATGHHFPTYTNVLDDKRDEVRAAAIDVFAALAPFSSKALPKLTILAKDKNPVIREKSQRAIARLRSPQQPWTPVPPLKKAEPAVLPDSESADDAVRYVELWQGQLRMSADDNVRLRAIECLGAIGGQMRLAIPRLVKLLERDPSLEVRRSAGQALSFMAPVAWYECAPLLLKGLEGAPEELRRQLVIGMIASMAPLSEPALPHVIKFMKHKDVELRRRAIWALEAFGPLAKVAVPDLIEALKDPDKGVPEKIMSVKEIAITVLCGIGPDASAAAPALWKIRRASEPTSRGARSALACLARITPKDKELLREFIANLGSMDLSTRHHAAYCIRFFGVNGKDAIPALVEALKANNVKHANVSQQIKQAIISSLEQVGREAVPALIDAFNGDHLNHSLRRQVIRALGEIGPPAQSALPLLEELADGAPRGRYRYRSDAEDAIKKIRQPQ